MRNNALLFGLSTILLTSLSLANNKEKQSWGDPRSYVKIEVAGRLFRGENSPYYYIEAFDVTFRDTKVIVNLGRSEDKNRQLDKHLKSLEGKMVVAKGFLNCSRIDNHLAFFQGKWVVARTTTPGGLWLDLGSEEQIAEVRNRSVVKYFF